MGCPSVAEAGPCGALYRMILPRQCESSHNSRPVSSVFLSPMVSHSVPPTTTHDDSEEEDPH